MNILALTTGVLAGIIAGAVCMGLIIYVSEKLDRPWIFIIGALVGLIGSFIMFVKTMP